MTALITAIDITNPIGRTFIGTTFDFPWGNIDNFDNAAIISFSKYRQLSQFSGNTGPGTQ